MPALSLYVHIPFCSRKCRYCDFYSVSGDPDLMERSIDALLREWKMRREMAGDVDLTTIYVGGGTPSLLSPRQWERLGAGLLHGTGTDLLKEWSVECNPESFSRDQARVWRDLGVTRLTFGIQSLHDRELALLGRRHTASQARRALGDSTLREFASVGADVMYGLPGGTEQSVGETVRGILESGPVTHLSAYELTIHPGTPLGRHARLLPLPAEESTADMFLLIGQWCRDKGLERYEISNLALSGHESRHNLAYWNHDPYIGIGPAAHSFLPPQRSSNAPNLNRYLTSLEKGRLPVDFREELDAEAMGREMTFLGLRTRWGIDEARYLRTTGRRFGEGREEVLERLVSDGLMISDRGWCRPTERGMLLADAIARELM